MPPRTDSNPWELAQGHLQQVLDEYSYKNWFSQTSFESYMEGELRVGVPSQFFADWLRDHYLEAICTSLRKVTPEFREINFVPVAEGEIVRSEKEGNASPARQVSRRKMAKVHQRYNGFNPRYTFDRFVIGSGNRFAHAAAKAVAESPGRAYNPLFLYGDTGLGKTHLMQAIGQELLSRDPNLRAVFISSEHFTNQLIESIGAQSTQRFRAKYRKVDVLLIDDIHFIVGKEATQ